MPTGRKEIRFEGSDLASGAYVVRLAADEQVHIRTLTVTR